MSQLSSRHTLSRRSVLLLSIILVGITACGNSASAANSLPSGKGPMPTITLDNTAPSNIDIIFNINMRNGSLSLSGHALSWPEFLLGYQATYQGKLVIFQKGEKVACNSSVLQNQGEIKIVPIPAAGTVIHCTYTSPQGTANWSITVPESPVITSPKPNSVITRSTATYYTMTVLPNCKTSGVELDYPDGRGGMAGMGNDSSVNCGSSQKVDTSTLPPGSGGIGVGEFLQPAYATNNPGFHSFTMQIYTSTTIPVTWK